tara:strand:- start:991 stop:1992 length:1002 start_codon:yes stop_codon:yes gene_type:complete
MYNYSISSVIIFLISLLYALLVGLGLYGYGMDYYGAYTKGFQWNINRVNISNYLGFRVVTLKIFGIYIGTYITTFILTLSTGFLIKRSMKLKKSFSLILFLLIFLISIHTWPIIMSTSNAMRQGLAMSFIFLALTNSQKNYYWMFFYSLIAAIMHKTGIFLFIIIIFATILYKFFKSFPYKTQVVNNLLIGLLAYIGIYYFFKIFILPEDHQPSRVISGDYRAAFAFIGIFYVILTFFFKGILTNQFNLIVYYYSFFAFPFLTHGLNWQYERLGMMMIIPYILSYGSIFDKISYKLYITSAFLLLLILTIYTGMYSKGLYYKDDPFLEGIVNF